MNFRRTFSDKPNAFRCKDTNSGYVFPLIVKNWKLLSPDIQRLKYLQKVCFIPDGCWCHVPQNKCMVKVENDFISPFQPNFHFYTPGKQNQVFKLFGNTSSKSDASADVHIPTLWVPLPVYSPSFTKMQPYEKSQYVRFLDSWFMIPTCFK